MRPITDVLVEFTRQLPPDLFADAGELLEDAVSGSDPDAPARALDDARQAGREEGRALAEADGEARLAALAEAHAADLLAARAGWASEEGAGLATRLREGLAALEESLARGLAAALPAFVAAAVRQQAGAEMRAAIAQLLAGGEGALITVSGPADLVAPLRDAFAGHVGVTITEDEVPDLRLRAGDTLISTQVAAWQARLLGVLEAHR